MRVRDAVVAVTGLAVGGALGAWLAGGGQAPAPPAPPRTVVVETRAPGPEPAPPAVAAHGPAEPAGVEERPAPQAAPPAAGPGIQDLQIRTAELDLELQRRILIDLGGKEAKPPPAPGYGGNPFAGKDPSALAELREEAERKVEEILERWRAAAPGKERAAAMKELRDPMRRLLETGGSMEYLRPLEEAAERGETAAERGSAMIATHTLWQPEVVDFLLARMRSPHPEVRLYAVEGLAWVRGGEAARASEGVLAGLEDADPKVRSIAAASIAILERRADRAAAIRDRIAREEDPGARKAMEEALRRLEAGNARR